MTPIWRCLALALALPLALLHSAHAAGQCREVTYLFGSDPTTPADLGDVPIGDHKDFLVFNNSTLRETSDGLEMLLTAPPDGPGARTGYAVERAGRKAEINSTFTLLYGVVSVTLAGNDVAGAVTSLVIMSNDKGPITPNSGDGTPFTEIDIELLGSPKVHTWDSNTFVQRAGDDKWFSNATTLDVDAANPASGNVSDTHKYTVDWAPDSITWSIDDQNNPPARVLQRSDMLADHFPDKPSSLAITQWDPSTIPGVSFWAGGPLDWAHVAEGYTVATLKRIDIRCPYKDAPEP